MAQEGGIDMLVVMLSSTHPHLQRQASKALANLGVNANNKERICHAGGVGPLVNLANSKSPTVAVEAVAALANLAVNGEKVDSLRADAGGFVRPRVNFRCCFDTCR